MNKKSTNQILKQEPVSKLDIQNLFMYLKQGVNSPEGLIDKTKALSNILMNELIFQYLIQSSLKTTTNKAVDIGSESVEGYIYTSVHTRINDNDEYSVYARYHNIRNSLNLDQGVVKGFLLRKENTMYAIKNMLEARLILNNGKECILKYNYSLPNLHTNTEN